MSKKRVGKSNKNTNTNKTHTGSNLRKNPTIKERVLLLKQYIPQMAFVFIVCIGMMLWYYMASTKWYIDTVLPPYTAFLASSTSFLLNIFGYSTVAQYFENI